MKLLCYALNDFAPKLVAARPERQWMEGFSDRHAYRCLPLTIANTHGWEMLCPAPIEILWNGGPLVKDLEVKALKPLPGDRPLDDFCRSNFARGVVTFHTSYIFRTEPGWDLLATGPLNNFKNNAAPMSGIIEADWLPYPFTMNWQVMNPGRVLFEEDEPFCFIFPIKKQALLDCQPEIHRLEEDAELSRQHEAFRSSRDEFMKRFHAGESDAIRQGWQRHYFLGRHPDGTMADQHMNKLRLKEPVDLRPPRAPRPAAARDPATPPRTDPRWDDRSVLNRIPAEQSERNKAGRRLLDREGRITRPDEVRVITSQAEAAGLDLVVVENLLSAAECDILCRTFWELEAKTFRSEKIDPFWNNRFVWFADVFKERPGASLVMLEAQRRGRKHTSDFYQLKEPIYPDLLQIVRWRDGMFMPPHADNANPDGSPHEMAHRDASGIIYLNDNYDGGLLYFTALGIAIKPKRGMYVSMTGGFWHEHGVTRVENGTRLTLPFFLTFARDKADQKVLTLTAA